MAEQSTAASGSGTTSGSGASAGASSAGGTSVARRGEASPLQTERGSTTIANGVVTKVAGIAAREVPGVHALGGGAARAFGAVTSRVGIGDGAGQGVSVEVGEREAAVDLTVVADYGESIPEVAQSIRDNVISRIEGITGLQVTEVNVSVVDLYFPGDDEEQQQQSPPPPARVA